jgi:hypothetical protein
LTFFLQVGFLCFESRDLLILLGHLFVESVSRSIQVADSVSHLLHLVLQVLLLHDFLIQGLFQSFLVFFEGFFLLLLLVVQLHDVVIHCLDFLGLRENDLFVVLLNRVVVHFGVALVAHAVEFLIGHAQLARVLGANLADGFRASLAVADGVSDHFGEGRLTELAELLVWSALGLHGLGVEGLGQTICFTDKLGFLAEAQIEVRALPIVDHDGLGGEVAVEAHALACTASTIEIDCRLIHLCH